MYLSFKATLVWSAKFLSSRFSLSDFKRSISAWSFREADRHIQQDMAAKSTSIVAIQVYIENHEHKSTSCVGEDPNSHMNRICMSICLGFAVEQEVGATAVAVCVGGDEESAPLLPPLPSLREEVCQTDLFSQKSTS